MLPVARLLQRSRSYTPVFWFVSRYPTLDDDRATCRRHEIAHTASDAPPTWLAPLQLVRTLRAVRHRIRNLRAALLVLPADNRYDLAVYVRAAHDEHVPVVIIPAFMAATREWAEAMSKNPDYSLDKLANRVAGWLYPRWIHEHDGKRMVALPGPQLLARQWLGLTPPLPWTLHSGHADAIAVESEAMKRYCLREGLPEERMVVTGSVDHDEMAARMTDAPRERVLLTALPPDQHRKTDFESYDAMVRFWITSLSRIPGWRTLVTLHPSVKRDSMKHLEDLGVTIADERTAALIPRCDLYVASVSATIQWAIACAKPVINYDVYRYRYPDYVGVRGVIATEDKTVFRDAVTRVTSDARYHAELVALQQQAAPDWGVLDGRAGARLLALFDQLTARA